MDDTTRSSSPLSSVPSSPLSFLSRSPTPTSADGHSLLIRKPYPSPSSSQDSSHNGSPCPDAIMLDTTAREDGQPPPKRRKLEPKPRTTLNLDLSVDHSIDGQKPELERLLKVLYKKRKIVVIAGAGISVSAGIPDFRSSTGLFKSLKSEHNLKSSGKDLFDASVYKDDQSTTSFHAMVRQISQTVSKTQPTSFHHMLATLANEGRLLRLYSQNIDGLETSLPPLKTKVPLAREDGAWPKTIQLHGGLEKMVCVKCHTLSDFDPELFDGPVPPLCKVCEAQDNVRTEHAGKRSHGIGVLRPRMVLYSEAGFDDESIGTVTRHDLKTRPDAVIVVGTTLKVPGVRRIAREMCNVVRDRRDGLTVWINNDDPPKGKDFEWDLVVKGPCDEVARHAAMRKWDDVFEEVTDEDMRKAREASEAKVIIVSPAKAKTFEQVHEIPTPVASPKFLPKTTKVALTAEQKQSAMSLASTTKLGEEKATARGKAAAAKRKRAPAKKPESKNAMLGFKITKPGVPATTVKLGDKIKDKPQPDAPDAENSAPSMAPLPQLQHSLQWQNTFSGEWKTAKTPRRPPPLSTPVPMAPISPQDARNNASPPIPIAPAYSPLTGYVDRSRSVPYDREPLSPSPPVPRRRSDGTISPTGYVPGDMRALLNEE